MGAGFGKEKNRHPDGFDPLPHGAYQMVPLDAKRTVIISSDHRTWTLAPSSKWRGHVITATNNPQVSINPNRSFSIPPNVSAAFEFEGKQSGPVFFTLETDGAPGETQSLMLSVLPIRRRSIGVNMIATDMIRKDAIKRSDVWNAVLLTSRLYAKQANVDLIDEQGYVGMWEFPLVDLGDPIMMTAWMRVKLKAKVGIFQGRINLVYSWDFENPDMKPGTTLDGVTLTALDVCFIDARREDQRDVVSTTIHELGHAFGLGHEENDPENIMYPNSLPNQYKFNSHQIEALNGFNSSFPTA